MIANADPAEVFITEMDNYINTEVEHVLVTDEKMKAPISKFIFYKYVYTPEEYARLSSVLMQEPLNFKIQKIQDLRTVNTAPVFTVRSDNPLPNTNNGKNSFLVHGAEKLLMSIGVKN